MFEAHKYFMAPENEGDTIWRYMDFTKFVSLLDTERLYFCRADKLEDPFEGSLPRPNATNGEWLLPYMTESAQVVRHANTEERRRANRTFVKCNAINCWHMNDGESAAMWKLYLKSDEGIAVRSTYSQLRDSINDPEPVRIGKVTYINYESDSIQTGNMMVPFLHKRRSYEHEKEIRAIVTRFPADEAEPWEHPGILANGIGISVNLHQLIQGVQVAPGSQPWFLDLVKSVCKAYGFAFDIGQSEMSSDALY
jgi:hypothetical protein